MGRKGQTAWNKGSPSPFRGIPRSEEVKRKIREGLKGKTPFKTSFKKGHIFGFKKGYTPWNKNKKNYYPTWNKGQKMSVETKIKWRNSRIGLKISKQGKENLRLAKLGNKNPAWKGGIISLSCLIKSCFKYEEWRELVFKRDDYTCQDCFVKGGDLEAHHKKAFRIIFQEFLQQYSQFSPIEDKETLVRLAITYEPFWDIDNGKTLCVRCHKKCTWIKKEKTVGVMFA